MKNDIKERIIKTLQEVHRDGIEDIINYLITSDFFTAPASTRYHLCREGGLAEHSLHVYECLLEKKRLEGGIWKEQLKDISEESIAVAALLHDLCKTYFYTVDYRNQKVYSENGTKTDAKGRYEWESVPYYTVDDKMPLGHGEKSVMLIEKYMKLTPDEMYAIRWHMGSFEPKENWNMLSSAFTKHPLALALYMSDLEATYVIETE